MTCFASKSVVLLIFILISLGANAQNEAENISAKKRPKIEFLARPLKDSIMLRWAPNNSMLWEDANKTGYILERITMMRDGKLLDNAEKVILTTTPILPTPLNSWEKAVKSNKYAAIAAQALYGETFDVKNKTATDLYSIITKVRERDTRYSFALFSADQSPEVARLSGLWYTDKNVKANEKYVYRVYLAQNKVKADTGFVYTGPSEYQPLPEPIDLKIEFKGLKGNISWNQAYFTGIYNSFILERSDDGGKTYNSVSDEPLVNLIPENTPAPELFYISDTIQEYNKKYYYRVKGINSFGETGPVSAPVMAETHRAIENIPYFVENKVVDNNKVVLRWEYPTENTNEIKGFKVARSGNPKTGFTYISKDIAASLREFTDTKPGLNNYYIIAAYNQYNEEVRSMPIFVQLIDSVPPIPPIGLTGKIDSTGKVTIMWKANLEKDMLGYRLYRANYDNEEYSQITDSPVADTVYYDKIELNTLTTSIFYKIMAIDQRQNHSSFSKSLEVKRPDRTPPVSPVFKDVRSAKEGVYMSWIKSSSSDVKNYALYRNIPGGKQWETLKTFEADDTTTNYLDLKASDDTYYTYTLIAKDVNGLESAPAKPVQGKKVDTGVKKGVEKLAYTVDRENGTITLTWKQPEEKVYKYLIYKGIGEGNLANYKNITSEKPVFSDSQLQINTIYKYMVKVQYSDGSQGSVSKVVIVNY